MTGRGNLRDPMLEELRGIRGVLEDLLILECARTGMNRPALRAVVGVDNNRISRIARYVRKAGSDRGETA